MLTFQKAEELLKKGRNGRKKLENNTYLEKLDENTFVVILHTTKIIQIGRDGVYTLNTGGYKTVTTKDRLNTYSPVGIRQKDYIWYVGDKEFTNGMKVTANGEIL